MAAINELKEHYNIDVSELKKLPGDVDYRNIKYEVAAKEGEKYILKIFPDKDELDLAIEETWLCNRIAPLLSFKVPLTLTCKNDELFFSSSEGPAKILHFIEGDFIMNVEQTPALLYELGEKTGEMLHALKGINSPLIRSRKIFWDIQNAELSFNRLQFIREHETRRKVHYFLDRFSQFVAPKLRFMRHSIIHGDLNDHNILVKDGRVEGFIDFGDSTYSPVVSELAVACAYMMMDKSDPVEDVLPLINGFCRVYPLEREEIEALPEMVAARLCISLCNSAEKRDSGVDNEYVLISEEPARELIDKLIEINPLRIKERFLEAGGFDFGSMRNRRERILSVRKKNTGSSLSLTYRKPVYMTGAAFQYMYDENGSAFLDTCNNIPHVGHCHPVVSEAVSKQSRILNTNTRYLYDTMADYIERLLEYFPPGLDRVFMVNSGSAATDLAVRMAQTFSGRGHMAVMEHGYHGNTLTAINMSSYKFDGKGGGGKPHNVIKLPLPKLFRGKYATGEEYAEEAKAILEERKQKGVMPAGLIAETVSGCGGQVPVAPGYFKILQPYLKENEILTVIDEVQTGFGRLGEYFWGFGMHGIIPDIVILGKPMGNGFPVAAVVTTGEVSAAFNTGMEFFSSFGGSTLSCKAAGAVLDVIEAENLRGNAGKVGTFLKGELLKLQKIHHVIADVRGEGLFLGVELEDEKGNPDTKTSSLLINRLRDKNVLASTDGPFNNVIKIKPPMCFTEKNAAHFAGMLDEFFSGSG